MFYIATVVKRPLKQRMNNLVVVLKSPFESSIGHFKKDIKKVILQRSLSKDYFFYFRLAFHENTASVLSCYNISFSNESNRFQKHTHKNAQKSG